ncbi:hypothetical protein [Aminobacter aminovorans]|jgi:hypothetical protein|uniref:hypothetical protein n=1 Tax=Aminobacter aminovorans TaxID=83263 RepID=UPI001404F50D|nr:hypothetical protein [Aminobacter aminovorans]
MTPKIAIDFRWGSCGGSPHCGASPTRGAVLLERDVLAGYDPKMLIGEAASI